MGRLATGLRLACHILEQIAPDMAPAPLSDAEKARVDHACALMQADLANAPDMVTLARLCGTNSGKLRRDFRALVGQAPHAWLQERRLQCAWHLLAERNCQVAQAAAATGYTPTHLATLFRRRFGIAPSKVAG